MPWRRARFKQSLVLARSDDAGNWVEQGGRVEIRYREGDPRAYHAAVRNLEPLPGASLLPDDACPPAQEPAAQDGAVRGGRAAGSRAASAKSAGTGSAAAVAADAIVVYADGACSGNPGPAGVGVVLIDAGRRRELSAYLGEATNNIAELTAILLAAESITDPSRTVRMFTDSQYAIGVLQKGWKAKANVELVAKVKVALARLRNVQLAYVPGHSGVVLNERADALAVQAVAERASTGWVEVG